MQIKCEPGVFEEDLECLKCSALNFRLIFGLFELAQLASKSSFLAPISLAGVTPGFKDKTECITICMPGSSFIHIETS